MNRLRQAPARAVVSAAGPGSDRDGERPLRGRRVDTECRTNVDVEVAGGDDLGSGRCPTKRC